MSQDLAAWDAKNFLFKETTGELRDKLYDW